MVRVRNVGLLWILLVLLTPNVHGADETRPCERETSSLMDGAASWEVVAEAADALPERCFDGYFAEGISETLSRKLANDWRGFFEVLRTRQYNRAVRDLVVRSLNATVDPRDIRLVENKARSECPSEAATICRRIADKASVVLESE